MQKNKNTKFRAIDLLILLLCIAGAGLSGSAFWREYNRTLVKLNEEPVGSIVFKNRTAHRKIENRAAWDRLKQESPVYNGDTIRTAEASEAFITFEDKVTQVNLYENTLIQVFYDGRETRIDFSGGSFDVSSGGRSVFITNGGSAIEVGSGSRASLNSGGEGFSFSVLAGQAKLADGTDLESGGTLSFLNDGTPDTGPAIAVTSLGRFARILGSADGTASAAFTWNAVNFSPDTHVILEAAKDREFSRIVQTRDAGGVSSAAVPLETGEYWWRAYPVHGTGREIPERGYASGRIEVLPFARVSALVPAPRQEFAFSSETAVPFSWTPVEGADAYLFEISADQDMNNPAVSRLAAGTSAAETGLEPGPWYWRVTPVFPDQVKGTASPSETGVFSIVTNNTNAPAAPALTVPAQDGVVALDRPRLSWKYDSGAVSWIVEVADNPQMSNPLLRQDSDSNFYSPPAGVLQKDKVYFWRVTAQGSRGTSSSPVRSFTAKEHIYRHRAVFPPDNYSITAEELGRIRFTYQSDVPFRDYFQVSSQNDFSPPEINDPVEAGGDLSVSGLEPGIWYWRIHADGESGPVDTAPRRLNIVSASEAPRVRGPDSLRRGSTLELDWDPLYFTSYQVSVYSADDPLNPVSRQTAGTSSAAVSTGSLEPGDYIVSVAGFNPESATSPWITGAAAETRFTLTPDLPPPPVITLIPAAAIIPEPEPAAAMIPPEPEPAAVAVLPPEPEPIIEPEPAAVVVLPPEPEPAAAVIPPPAPEPIIEPEPAAVVVLPPEPEPAAVVVLPPEPEPAAAVIPPEPIKEPAPAAAVVPPPSPPKPAAPVPAKAPAFVFSTRPIPGSFPPNGYVLSTEQLADTPSVNFVWEGGAPGYRFTLYKADGEVIVSSVVLKAPLFTMQNPRILEPGDYVWEVSERDRRGRFGDPMASRFTVNEGPAVLKTLPTNDPGVLYGR